MFTGIVITIVCIVLLLGVFLWTIVTQFRRP